MAKLRMAHASTHGARKPPGPIGHDVAHPQALKKVTKDYEGNSSALTEDTVVDKSPI